MTKLLNPWAILAVVLAVLASGAYGRKLGIEHMLAQQAKEKTLEERIQRTLAEEVSKIKVVNTTTRQTIHAKTVEVPVYRECRHDPDTRRLLDDILTGKTTVPAGGVELPATDTAR